MRVRLPPPASFARTGRAVDCAPSTSVRSPLEKSSRRSGRMAHVEPERDRDVQRLAELGYRQELSRAWSGFSNFAISFTIISILAGCFTTYGQAWNNGGPIAISWAWPIVCGFVLIIAFCMAELASAYPTA